MARKPPPPAAKPSKPSQESVTVSANWSGPLPPPGALQAFDAIIENGAERIIRMVEEEQQHRIEQDRTGLRAEIIDTIGGKILGASITLVAIGASVYVTLQGHPWVGGAIVGLPITALIGKFIKK